MKNLLLALLLLLILGGGYIVSAVIDLVVKHNLIKMIDEGDKLPSKEEEFTKKQNVIKLNMREKCHVRHKPQH